MALLDGLLKRRAFRAALAQSRGRLYRTAYAWCHDPHLAEDLVQQALCKALQSQEQLKDVAATEAWLLRIMSNCLTDHRRSRREVLTDDDIEIVDPRTPEHDAREQEIVRRVRNAVAALPLEQRQVVTLVDLEGFAYAKVAEVLEIPVGTVMSRLCRGRRALREKLIRGRTADGREGPVALRRVK